MKSINTSESFSSRLIKKIRDCNRIGFAFLGPLYPLLIFCLLVLSTFFIFRFLHCLNNFDRVSTVDNFFLLFPIGVRMDTILISFLIAPLFLVLILLPAKLVRVLRPLFSAYFAFFLSILTFMEIATFPFLAEFDTRPDRLFVEHIVQAKEVFAMVWRGYLVELCVGIPVTFFCAIIVYTLFQKIFNNYPPVSIIKRIILFIIVAPLLVVGARSSIGHRPANISTAAFSSSHLVNQLGINSTYSVIYAYYRLIKHERDPAKIYGRMKSQKMFDKVFASAGITNHSVANPENNLFHYQQSNFPRKQPLNLVIILEESLGAEYVGFLGGLPLTPNIDRLSEEGVSFTSLYSTGTRTVRGIEAIISGFLPTPGKSVVKLELSQQNFFTIAGLLAQKGYSTEFIYGGDSKFDNMKAFFLSNGFQNIYDHKVFNNPVFDGTWGVSDEDLFREANEIFKSHNEKPFFSLILSTSNHDPFEFPDGRIELYEQPKMSRHNAMKYADYSVGRFFEMAKKEDYYKNTVFLIIADHSTRLRGEDLIPIHKFHIPGIIIGPGIEPQKYEKVCSQIDMPSTLLDLIGVSATHPFIGRPLLSLSENVPGRAIMQYGEVNAYMVDNKVVVNRPKIEPSQYTYQNKRLIPTSLDPELADTALAFALLPGYLYKNRLYRLSAGENKLLGVKESSGK